MVYTVADDGWNTFPTGPSVGPPEGHTRLCWAAVSGESQRGRWVAPEDRRSEALRLYAAGACECRDNKGKRR